MVFRPFGAVKGSMDRSKRRAICSASHMPIGQPLTRATNAAAQLRVDRSNGRALSTYYYQFPKIPRPKRNIAYYKSWSPGPIKNFGSRFGRMRVTPRSFSTMSLRRRPHLPTRLFRVSGRRRRMFSSGSKQQSTKSLRNWFTLSSIGVILYGVVSKINHDNRVVDDGQEVRPTSWSLYAYSTLPLKALSRLWGKVNSVTLPVWLRAPGYRLYAYVFGANLDDMAEPDLTSYENLGQFFYRSIKPEVRPIAYDAELNSPCDGRVLKYGTIEDGEIEQVKGMTYSLDALLGKTGKTKLAAPVHDVAFPNSNDETVYKRHEEFATLNGISYTVDDIIGGEGKHAHHMNKFKYKDEGDASVAASSTPNVLKVSNEVNKRTGSASKTKELFFAVIYLAPGDYHRFHSPTNWVCTLRRHFVGELYSVAPYFQRTLSGLFVLNERVALLGYWKHGFFSMTPVGATNVGSIKINFDKDLTTNSVYESTMYSDSASTIVGEASEKSSLLSGNSSKYSSIPNSGTETLGAHASDRKKVRKNTCYEATYKGASKILGGQPLSKGQEVGGFKLGSTVVLVFEAPQNFRFKLEEGQYVKMGQAIGEIERKRKV
ncbi:unnamed protein product [Kuraishia capsulata CBS 1993]|uniref:Phosphatidylserine decarboxylase proenzyme 1, mitochondrial n=1 Tax=Kuraishia capsulata CBS 1993 TaxID=1382522 RepID=W6MQN7_9ASCO|nr:uncharacterized protein KUCA_T00000165001 [Kuraishia capsulata CBS 1993]CDK24205.1 unnamed protein product [Kuraishia capsulata CBS 1993]